MLTSRITDGEIFLSHSLLWRSVFALVGLLTLKLLTLDLVWLLYLSYNTQTNKEKS